MNRVNRVQQLLGVILLLLAVQTVGCPGGSSEEAGGNANGAGAQNDNANTNGNGNANGNVNENVNGNANVNVNGNDNANVNGNDNGNANDNVNTNGDAAGPKPVVIDSWTTISSGQTQTMQKFEADPLPQGFFDFNGQSCEAFSGEIVLEGVPIDPIASQADTVVRRFGDPIDPDDAVGTEGSVEIEIIALSLQSVQPITVVCDGADTSWNVAVNLSDAAAPRGTLTATKERDNGGSAVAVLNVLPRLTFANVADPAVEVILDPGPQGEPITFEANMQWIHSIDPNDASLPRKFIIGKDDSQVLTRQALPEGCEIVTMHTPFDQPAGFGAQHLHAVCPPDADADGWPDQVDNCPNIGNRDQIDEDGDGVGDACGPEALGDWAGALGNYIISGTGQQPCQDDTRVTLVMEDGSLVLRELDDNNDINLMIDGPVAAGSNVTAFLVPGHNIRLTLEGAAIAFHLEMPEAPAEIFCDASMTRWDRDCFQSQGQGTITLDVEDVTCAAGIPLDLASAGFDSAIVEVAPGPYAAGEDIDTELVQLELAADGGALGPIVVRERDDVASTGLIQNVEVDNGDFARGDSFFDVFIEIEMADASVRYDTGETPFRLDAGTITELPPLSTDYLPPPDAEPVPLFQAGTSFQVGWFCHSQHTPTETIPCE